MARTTKLLLTATFAASAILVRGGGARAAAGGQAPSGQTDLSVKQRPMLTAPEMVSQSKEYFKNMNDILKRIAALQDQSKRQKDIIRLNCVTDKLVQSKVNLTIAEQSIAALQESITRADEGGRAHEFTRLTILNQKVLVLGAEAENCIGEDLSFVGATRIDVEIDPNIPTIDISVPPTTVIDVTRPPPASPYSGT